MMRNQTTWCRDALITTTAELHGVPFTHRAGNRAPFAAVLLRADLVPVYSFGENELFRQVIFSEGSVGRRLQDLFKRLVGFAPCVFLGDRFGLLAYQRPITTVGEPSTPTITQCRATNVTTNTSGAVRG